MRKKQLFEGVLALCTMVFFTLVFFGAGNLLNDNPVGYIEVGLALVIAVPVVILANREEKA